MIVCLWPQVSSMPCSRAVFSIFRSVIPVVYLRTKQTNSCRKSSQKHNYNCNIQGVSVYTTVSANYMFRPLLVRPSSGWIPQSEEMYNSAIQPFKSGGKRSRLQKWGVCTTYWYKYMYCLHQSVVTYSYLSIIGRLVRVLRGTIFEKKVKVTGHKMCFDFLYNFCQKHSSV